MEIKDLKDLVIILKNNQIKEETINNIIKDILGSLKD